MSAHKEQAAALIAAQHGITMPVNIETLRAINSYAVQFRYEGSPVELAVSAECEAITTALSEWVEAH
jgi:hypothetical protein